MPGTATIEFKGTAIDHFALKPGSFVYVPAGAPHRIVPAETSVVLRYKQMHAGLEGVVWYAALCTPHTLRHEAILGRAERIVRPAGEHQAT